MADNFRNTTPRMHGIEQVLTGTTTGTRHAAVHMYVTVVTKCNATNAFICMEIHFRPKCTKNKAFNIQIKLRSPQGRVIFVSLIQFVQTLRSF